MSFSQASFLAFLLLILVGTGALMLPVSTRPGRVTQLTDALFTATSAVCVTGLSVVDTYTHWSLVGQLVILLLIQVGGLGLMILVIGAFSVLGKRIGLQERAYLRDSTGSASLSGMVVLVKHILLYSGVIEAVGTAFLAIRFVPQFGIWRGLYMAMFHAITSFTHAGLDLMGIRQPFSSMSAYVDDPLVLLTMVALITLGGLGFIVWEDLVRYRLRWQHWSLQTNIVLVTNTFLLLGGMVCLYVFEADASMAGMPVWQRLVVSLFYSASARTASFHLLDPARLTSASSLLMAGLMLIGGSPGSMAGGIKTTTFFVLVMALVQFTSGQPDVVVFRKRIDKTALHRATVIATLYLLLVAVFSVLISAVERLPVMPVVHEVISALATVGFSTGITANLDTFSRICLVILMFVGRLGGFTLMALFGFGRRIAGLQRPEEQVLIG